MVKNYFAWVIQFDFTSITKTYWFKFFSVSLSQISLFSFSFSLFFFSLFPNVHFEAPSQP